MNRAVLRYFCLSPGALFLGFLSLFAASSTLLAAPRILNHSFEDQGDGLAFPGVGVISNWFFAGNVGVNPIFPSDVLAANGQKPNPFADNGAVPDGPSILRRKPEKYSIDFSAGDSERRQ